MEPSFIGWIFVIQFMKYAKTWRPDLSNCQSILKKLVRYIMLVCWHTFPYIYNVAVTLFLIYIRTYISILSFPTLFAGNIAKKTAGFISSFLSPIIGVEERSTVNLVIHVIHFSYLLHIDIKGLMNFPFIVSALYFFFQSKWLTELCWQCVLIVYTKNGGR